MPDGSDHNEQAFEEQDGPAIVYHNPVAQRRHESREWMKGAVAFVMATVVAGLMFFGVRSSIDAAWLGVGSSAQEAEQTEGAEGAEGAEGEAPAQEEAPAEEPPAEEPVAEAAAPVFTGVGASSELQADNETRTYVAGNAVDGNLQTAWNEGSSGDGVGEWIEVTADGKQHVTGLRIAAGFQVDEGTYYNNRRPSRIQVSFDDFTNFEFDLEDIFGDYQTLTFPEPKDTASMRITIMATYAGNAYNDCCISEIQAV